MNGIHLLCGCGREECIAFVDGVKLKYISFVGGKEWNTLLFRVEWNTLLLWVEWSGVEYISFMGWGGVEYIAFVGSGVDYIYFMGGVEWNASFVAWGAVKYISFGWIGLYSGNNSG